MDYNTTHPEINACFNTHFFQISSVVLVISMVANLFRSLKLIKNKAARKILKPYEKKLKPPFRDNQC